MTSKRDFTTTELSEIKEYIDAGFTYREIGEIVGRTTKSIENVAHKNGWKSTRPLGRPKKSPTAEEDIKALAELKAKLSASEPAPEMVVKVVKEKTLNDFQPRDMIRHLYNLGYRIEDNRLVCIVKQVVNLKDIINA